MTKKELTDLIEATTAPQWYNTVEINLSFHKINVNINLKGFTSIYYFFQRQLDGWEKLNAEIPSVFNPSKDFFKNILQQLNTYPNNYKQYNESQLNNQWNNLKNRWSPNSTRNILTFDCPETEFFIRLHKDQPNHVQGAYKFFELEENNSFSFTKKDFVGAILYYEFQLKDQSQITERRNAEKASISRLRNEFEKYLSKSEEQLNTHLISANTNYKEYVKVIDEFKADKEKLFTEWYDEAKANHDTFVKETNDNRDNIEKTYRELLSLKAPAEYWKKRATELKAQGWKSLNWLIFLVVLGAGLLFSLLLLLPGETLAGIFKTTGSAIKWSIVFITFISFMAYGIGLLAKVSFSAFHLARDSEEREQLTYLYLSLKNDGNVDEKDRQLVLQSLFSRADTGLLKDDASPTMPGATGFMSKFIS